MFFRSLAPNKMLYKRFKKGESSYDSTLSGFGGITLSLPFKPGMLIAKGPHPITGTYANPRQYLHMFSQDFTYIDEDLGVPALSLVILPNESWSGEISSVTYATGWGYNAETRMYDVRCVLIGGTEGDIIKWVAYE